MLSMLAAPLVLVSRLALFFAPLSLSRDLNQCCVILGSNEDSHLERYVDYLVAAEDHRFFRHRGIDVIAIARAAGSILLRARVQGASTIEQQLVRVVCGRYERTLRRKLREQILAIAISHRFDKRQIARCYLSVAYYGHQLLGGEAIRTLTAQGLCPATMALVVARLKYPQPKVVSEKWKLKIEARAAYIIKRMRASAPIRDMQPLGAPPHDMHCTRSRQ